jgi:signal peptidase II
MLSQPGVAQRTGEALARQGNLSASELLHALNLSRGLVHGVQITLSTNPGVVFGLPMPRWAVAVATFATVVLVGYFFATSLRRDWIVHLALASVLAGALGNLYDRLLATVAIPGADAVIRGQVRDFINCSDLHYPYIFNVADVLLVVGVALLLIHWWRLPKAGKGSGQQVEASPRRPARR